MIAMALSCHPQLLIADEPTTALDVTTQAPILDLMLELQETYNMAIMFITHDLGVVAEIADMIFQDPYSSLNPRMTVFEIVSEVLKVNHLADGSEA